MKWLRNSWGYIKFSIIGLWAKARAYGPTDKALLLSLSGWEKENEEVKILSISMWNEGKPCDHFYKKVESSKEHIKDMKATGTHKDYICAKCGQPFCCVVGDEAVKLYKTWESISR